ncbi:glycosyltransferase [uncultured Flavobacterium sp.]|uniref:glycosyltransferase n=1 Tax=uncultured Flavobacterium sp. TaxID=165435 RepID=UPI0025E3C884|nr:glycosyltransferase [uncultured Flavobacterium sp.]
MRILINTATTYKGGGVQVASSFIEECRNFPEHEYHVILGVGIAKITDTTTFPPNFTFYKIPYRPAERVFSFKDQAAFMKEVEKKAQPECVFTTSGPAYWRPKAPHLMGFNLAHYLYPESQFYKIISKVAVIRWKLRGMVIKHFFEHDADAYVVQTDDINERLVKWLGNPDVHTVTNTYGSQYDRETSGGAQFLPDNRGEEFRLLMLSSYYPHKNFEIINEIVSQLDYSKGGRAVKFVVTLPDDVYKRLFTEENRRHIYNVGPVKPVDCPQLYTECDAVFTPTLLECFSATYAEGMKMKVPIVTTDLGFAHTVCGDAALYFTPLDAGDAIKKILLLCNDEQLQRKLVEAGQESMKKFNSSRERAIKFLEISENLIKKSGAR